VGRAVGGRVGRLEFGPGEQAGAVCRWLAFEGGDEDDIPLQTLGLVNGEEFDERLARRDGGWRLNYLSVEDSVHPVVQRI
jgi:hypothetical protein